MNQYLIGSSADQILLTALINAPGPAYSNAISVNMANEAEPAAQLGHSNNPDGSMRDHDIGNAHSLAARRLGVLTKIGIPGNTVEDRKQAAERISARYTINGGEAGSVDYDNPQITVSDDAATVFLNFGCDLK